MIIACKNGRSEPYECGNGDSVDVQRKQALEEGTMDKYWTAGFSIRVFPEKIFKKLLRMSRICCIM
jgi:hypothetical protein